MMAAGLRATAKEVDHPPEPKIGAPVLDPTANGIRGRYSPLSNAGDFVLYGRDRLRSTAVVELLGQIADV